MTPSPTGTIARRLFASLIALALTLLALSSAARARQTPPRDTTPQPQVRLALELTRADGGSGEATPAGKVVATPVLTAFSRNSGAIQVTGGDLSFNISLSPEVEKNNRLALLFTLQLSGKSLPGGVTSANLSGGTRVTVGRREPVAEVALRDPRTGRTSTFCLFVTATVSGATIAPSAAPPASSDTPSTGPARVP